MSRVLVLRCWLPVFAGLGAVSLAGCDLGPQEDSIVYLEEILLRFPFSADSLEAGQPFTVRSTRGEDMASRLAARGFSPEEIVGAQVRSGFAEVLFPLQQPIGFIDDLTLSLFSSDTAVLTAATRSGFPSGDVDVAEVTPADVDLGPLADDTDMRGRLRLVVNDLTPGATYEVSVQFLFEVEVRGF